MCFVLAIAKERITSSGTLTYIAQPIPAEGHGFKCQSMLAAFVVAKMQGHLVSKQNMNRACVLAAFMAAF